MIHEFPPLILASASPRRRELLETAGFSLKIIPTDVDEEFWTHPDPGTTALLRATAKAAAVTPASETDWVVAADTVVAAPDGSLPGNPQTADEARPMLETLLGTTHEVLSAAVVRRGTWQEAHVAVATISLRQASREELEAYLASGEPLGKAGGLCVQGLGRKFVERIEGEEAVVIGLPLTWLTAFFQTRRFE